MSNLFQIFISVLILILGIPIGNLLAKYTHEELKQGRKYFNWIILICLAGSILAIIFRNDSIFFSLLFIAIVTSRSLK